MVFGTSRVSIVKTDDLLGFSYITICRLYREWSERGNNSTDQQFCPRKSLVDERGEKRTAQADVKAILAQIRTLYNGGIYSRVSPNARYVEPWDRWATAAEDYTECHFCQRKEQETEVQFAKDHKKWTKEDCKTLSWCLISVGTFGW